MKDKFTWQETLITAMAMVGLVVIFLVMALVFHQDGKIALGVGLGLLALANAELRKFILSVLPKYLPKNSKKNGGE